MLFKAKPTAYACSAEHYSYDWSLPLDDEGYVHGWYVDGFIVGAVQESTEEYIALDFWCPIEKDTLEAVKGVE